MKNIILLLLLLPFIGFSQRDSSFLKLNSFEFDFNFFNQLQIEMNPIQNIIIETINNNILIILFNICRYLPSLYK